MKKLMVLLMAMMPFFANIVVAETPIDLTGGDDETRKDDGKKDGDRGLGDSPECWMDGRTVFLALDHLDGIATMTATELTTGAMAVASGETGRGILLVVALPSAGEYELTITTTTGMAFHATVSVD